MSDEVPIRRILDERRHLPDQIRKITVDRIPNKVQVDLEVAVGQRVAHLVGECQRRFRMRIGKTGVMRLDIVAGLTDDFEGADHGILSHRILHEDDLAHAVGIAIDARDGFEDVRQIVRRS